VVGVLVAGNFLFYDIRLDQLMAFFVTNAYALAKVLNMDVIAKTMPPPTRASYLSYPDATQTAYCGAIVAWIVAAFLKWRKKL
jgi:hypothetical protein